MNLRGLWSCLVTTVIVQRAWCITMIHRRRRTEKYISYYLVLLTGTQNWLNAYSTVYYTMCTSVPTAFITLLFFSYPVTKREKARERKKTHNHLVACWIIFHPPTLLREQGFFLWKKEYWLLKVSITTNDGYIYIIIQCNVVNEVDSSYLKSESLSISARLFVVLTARFLFIISDIAYSHDSSNDTLSLITIL